MGDTKLRERFRGFCEVYRAEISFEGVVERFDTLPLINPDRLTRGLYVRADGETRFVEFNSKGKLPTEIGDHVLVAGRVARKESDNISPAAILNSSKRFIQFPKDIRPRIMTRDIPMVLPEIVGLALIAIALWTTPMFYFLLYFLGWVLFFSGSIIRMLFKEYLLRSRLYPCDAMTWEVLLGEISSRYTSATLV